MVEKTKKIVHIVEFNNKKIDLIICYIIIMYNI